MKNTYYVMLLLVGLLITGCATQQTTGNVVATKEPIKIGFSTPITGALASWGNPAKNGAEIAVNEINAAGGINGHQIELIVEDDECDPKAGVAVMNKLVSQDKVIAVTGPICSGAALAQAPIAEQNHIVHISIGASSPALTKAGDYIFRVWPSDNLAGRALADYVYAQKHSRVALLVVNNDYGVGVGKVFETHYAEIGGTIVMKEMYLGDNQDFRTPLAKIKELEKNNQVDAIVVIQYDEAAQIHKQLAQLEITLPVYGTESYEAPAVVKASEGTMNGAQYVIPAFDESSTGVKSFTQKYTAAYGEEPGVKQAAVYGYDALYLIADGLRKDQTSEGLKAYLYGVHDRQTVGGVISFDSDGDVTRQYAIKEIVDGKPVVVKQ